MARTNVELDSRLVTMGFRLTQAKTKKELVNLALAELVRRKRRKGLITLMGSGCWQGNLAQMRRARI